MEILCFLSTVTKCTQYWYFRRGYPTCVQMELEKIPDRRTRNSAFLIPYTQKNCFIEKQNISHVKTWTWAIIYGKMITGAGPKQLSVSDPRPWICKSKNYINSVWNAETMDHFVMCKLYVIRTESSWKYISKNIFTDRKILEYL